MSLLITPRPNFIIPVFQEVVEADPPSIKIQYKPFFSFYQWQDFIDLTPIIGFVPTLTALIDAAATAAAVADGKAEAAQATADDALAAATAAQSTADDALSLATSGGGGRRATMWMDEAHYIVGTPTLQINTAYIGNIIRFTTTDLAEFTFSFVSGALNDGGIYLIGTKGNSSGIVEVRIDGTLVGSVDLYNATTLTNQIMLVGFGFGNPTFGAGYHKLSVKVNGKFVLSSGYAASFSKIYIRTNAD